MFVHRRTSLSNLKARRKDKPQIFRDLRGQFHNKRANNGRLQSQARPIRAVGQARNVALQFASYPFGPRSAQCSVQPDGGAVQSSKRGMELVPFGGFVWAGTNASQSFTLSSLLCQCTQIRTTIAKMDRQPSKRPGGWSGDYHGHIHNLSGGILSWEITEPNSFPIRATNPGMDIRAYSSILPSTMFQLCSVHEHCQLCKSSDYWTQQCLHAEIGLDVEA
jgi:hypothetical protein